MYIMYINGRFNLFLLRLKKEEMNNEVENDICTLTQLVM